MGVTIDWESRSAVDIKTRGAHVYMTDSTTEPVCLAAAVDNNAPMVWVPDHFRARINTDNIRYDVVSQQVIVDAVMSADKVIAHNSMFEYLLWNWIMVHRHGWPELPLDKLHCTMAQCAYHALPFGLEQAAQVLRLPTQKDMEGSKAMMKMCKPRKPRKAEREEDPDWAEKLYWWEDADLIETNVNYCCQDVEAERVLYRALAPLPEKERQIWLLDQKMNLRGVHVDLENVEALIQVVQEDESEQLKRFQDLTRGAVSGPRSYVALRNWVNDRTGLRLSSLDKAATEELPTRKNLDPVVREVLQIKSELGKSSVSKFKAMRNRSNGGRVQGWARYHGAATGRWAAQGLQLHNSPRDSYKPSEYEEVLRLIHAGDIRTLNTLWDNPYFVASRCVRGSITAGPGRTFLCADFRSIEGRGLAYLAGEQWVVDAYREGTDMYKLAAVDIFGERYDAVGKEQRQTGKVSELALGYAGGIGAYVSMAAGYDMDLETLPALVLPHATREELDGPYGATALAKRYTSENPDVLSLDAAIACDIIKRKWRAARPMIVELWKRLNEAALKAVADPGQVYSYRGIKYVVHYGFLKCLLPSGRVLHYYQPHIKTTETDWGESKTLSYWGLKVADGSTTRQWTEIISHGGKLTENVVQAYCRDILADAMLRLDRAGYDLVLHVHDEAVAEVDESCGSDELARFEQIMQEVPPYAQGMPIDTEGWMGKRYRK